MVNQTSRSRLTAILWFVAAGLAILAVGIRFAADRHMNWPLAAGGLFCLVMGIASLSRSRPSPPPA